MINLDADSGPLKSVMTTKEAYFAKKMIIDDAKVDIAKAREDRESKLAKSQEMREEAKEKCCQQTAAAFFLNT